jgi:hypothetical protein
MVSYVVFVSNIKPFLYYEISNRCQAMAILYRGTKTHGIDATDNKIT